MTPLSLFLLYTLELLPPTCAPFEERCVGSIIYTCNQGKWVRGLDCSETKGVDGQHVVCSEDPDGLALCVEDP